MSLLLSKKKHLLCNIYPKQRNKRQLSVIYMFLLRDFHHILASFFHFSQTNKTWISPKLSGEC